MNLARRSVSQTVSVSADESAGVALKVRKIRKVEKTNLGQNHDSTCKSHSLVSQAFQMEQRSNIVFNPTKEKVVPLWDKYFGKPEDKLLGL